MKKNRISAIMVMAAYAALVLLLFPACSNEKPDNEPFDTIANGQAITISFNDGTKSGGRITSDKGVYTFSYSNDGTLSITYPNGFLYTQRSINGGTSSSFDDEAVSLGYIDGMSLGRAINAASDRGATNAKAVSPIVSVLLLVLGALFIFAPKGLWWISRGWMYKNVEPSDLALGMYRVIGVVVVIAGVITFFA